MWVAGRLDDLVLGGFVFGVWGIWALHGCLTSFCMVLA